jgi:glycosyltransferase involved in cell wall biosynthesis
MKIAIEAQRIFRKKKHGMDIVALELIRHLQETDHENEYFILVRRDKDRGVLSETKNFHIVELPSVVYPLWEQYYLPRAIRRIKPDILHCTGNTAPLRLPKEIQLILTLHDILFIQKMYFSNGTLYQKLGNLYRRWLVPKIVPRCAQIITVSNFEKSQILAYFQLSPSSVKVVSNAFSRQYYEDLPDDKILFYKKKYHLPGRYILFLGNTDPKKNTENVLKAFAIYCKNNKGPVSLVMPDVSAFFLRNLLHKIRERGIRKFIHLTGYVSNDELPYLYKKSSLFLYPSYYESFGIPLLEAMASGIPVISSLGGAIPEITAGAAFLVNPDNPDEIASAMREVLSDVQKRDTLKKRGLIRAAEFNWQDTAIRTLEIYKETIRKHILKTTKITTS